MNGSSSGLLRVYFSKETLSTRFADYSNVYLFPGICLFGIVTNLLDLTVTLQIRPKDNIIKYIYINSAADLLFLLTQVFVSVVRCGALCPYGYTYVSKLYEMVIYSFARHVLITFQAIFNLFMTIENLKLFYKNQNKKWCRKIMKTKWFLVAFATVAFLINLPSNIISREVVPFAIYKSTNNKTTADECLYEKRYLTSWKANASLQGLLTAVILLRYPFLYVLIGMANILVAIKFHQFIKNKKLLLKNTLRGK
jgi:hypothetical protein